jgi:two-component system, NarL family, sensor histidine kinase NreB
MAILPAISSVRLGVIVGAGGSDTASRPGDSAHHHTTNKLWMALEQTADSVLITDRDGVIEYVNPAFEAMSGYTRAEAIGGKANIVRSGFQSREFYQRLWSTILSGGSFRCTVKNRRRDGTLYDEDQMITPIRDDSGAITHFVSTGRDVTQRNRTQEALRRLNHQLEGEATRIAGTLHDEAGQFLSAAHITLADVARDVDPAVRERLNEVRRHLDLVEERLRHVAHDLHPRVVEDLGLRDAVTFFAEAFARRSGIDVRVECSLETRYPMPVETLMYRIVQEGLTNVSRHARARHAVVTLDNGSEAVRCSIRDDGIGFDPSALASRAETSLGLRVMEDRLEAEGGTLTIASVPGRGTELRASVPVEC